MTLLCRRLIVVLLAMASLPAPAVSPTVAAPVPPIVNPLLAQADVLTVRVRQSGILTFTGADLIAAGWPASLDPRTIRVVRRGLDLPIQVSGEADGRLDTLDLIRFIAQANQSPYTTEATYWLLYGGGRGLRAPLPSAPDAPLVWEQDRVYQSVARTWRGDRWFAGELRPGSAPLSMTVTLPEQAPAGSSLEIAVTPLVRRANHQIAVSANGTAVGGIAWSDAPGATGPLSLTLLLEQAIPAGTVRFDLALASAGMPADALLIDRLALPGVRVRLPALPAPRLVAPVRLSQNGGDALIISHHTLLPELAPLAAAKQARGQSVAVLDVQAAYDAFSFGERDPEAIRSLVRWGAATWTPPPRSVLLVGAGGVSMRAASDADPTLIPPYLLDIDPKNGEVACDTCYTRLDAPDPRADLLPDIPIGRFPAHTAAEARVLVAKTVQRLSAPPTGAWRGQALALADNDWNADGSPDPAGSFTATADGGLELLPGTMRVERFYYAPGRPGGAGRYSDPGALRAGFLPSFDAGAALLLYVGHASPWQWAFTEPNAGVPYLFNLYDADARANGGKLPILLTMSCLSGNFANPILQTTDERLLLRPNGGIIAALSPAGSGVNSGHAALLSGVVPRLFAAQGERTLGQAHLEGLERLVAGGRDSDLAYSFNLLGDPDVTLPAITPASVWLPLVRR